jgi:hypothetical protein
MLEIFGEVKLPEPLEQGYGKYNEEGLGLIGFLSNIFKLVILAAGLYFIINVILAGYKIMTSQGDPEKLNKGQNQIWNSIIGMVVVIASFAIAALLGWILYQDATALLKIKIYGVGID